MSLEHHLPEQLVNVKSVEIYYYIEKKKQIKNKEKKRSNFMKITNDDLLFRCYV